MDPKSKMCEISYIYVMFEQLIIYLNLYEISYILISEIYAEYLQPSDIEHFFLIPIQVKCVKFHTNSGIKF